MKRVLAAPLAVLLHLDPVRIVLLALGTRVVAPLAVRARERDDVSGHYSVTLATTPAPTVRPPSRIANRSPSSSATDVISATSIVMLSPGITISTPSGSLISPVTSVVRN